mgnify:CR=1 FL=1
MLLDKSNWEDIHFVRQHLEQYENHLNDVFAEDTELDKQLFADGLRHEEVLIAKLEKQGFNVAHLPAKQKPLH